MITSKVPDAPELHVVEYYGIVYSTITYDMVKLIIHSHDSNVNGLPYHVQYIESAI